MLYKKIYVILYVKNPKNFTCFCKPNFLKTLLKIANLILDDYNTSKLFTQLILNKLSNLRSLEYFCYIALIKFPKYKNKIQKVKD